MSESVDYRSRVREAIRVADLRVARSQRLPREPDSLADIEPTTAPRERKPSEQVGPESTSAGVASDRLRQR